MSEPVSRKAKEALAKLSEMLRSNNIDAHELETMSKFFS